MNKRSDSTQVVADDVIRQLVRMANSSSSASASASHQIGRLANE